MSVEPEQLEAHGARIRLVAQHKNARQPKRELNQTITVLGSGDGCDLILSSTKVDAAHAAIIRLDDSAYLCDLGAASGTLLNGRRVRWARLNDGDVPALGPFAFKVELQDGPNPVRGEPPKFSLRNDRVVGIVQSVDPVLVIGSDPTCDVVLNDAAVSPRHALVVWTQNGPVVRDLLKKSSVRVNGEKTCGSGLMSGDCIGVGRCELIFETNPDSIDLPGGDGEMHRNRPSGKTDSRDAGDGPGISHGSAKKKMSGEGLAIPLMPVNNMDDDGANPPRKPDLKSTAKDSSLRDREDELKARVVAAQNALDERARRLWDGLAAERERLRVYQRELQEKSKELLGAAKETQRELQSRERELEKAQPERAESTLHAVETTTGAAGPILQTPNSALNIAIDEAPAFEKVFNGLFEPEAATLRNAEETARLAETLIQSGFRTPEVDTNLARQATELAELVRYEREEMENAEGRLETLRFEIERIQATIARAKDRQRLQAEQLEARTQSIRQAQGALRQERDELAAKIRQVEAKDAALKVRVDEAERSRRDLERENRQLAKVQEEYEVRRCELRVNIESERHRLRIRQAELQKRAAELVNAAKAKRRIIETEVATKQAEIAEREIELRARRAALEDAGRAQLEKTAAELEQVTTVRLNEIESEVEKRQIELDQRMQELISAAGARPGTTNGASPIELTLDEISALARLEGGSNQGDATRLEALHDEVEALRQAVGRFDEKEESFRAVSDNDQLAALNDRRNQLQREQRWATILRAKLNEKTASLRANTDATSVGTTTESTESTNAGPAEEASAA